MTMWSEQKKRCIWFKVNIKDAAWVPLLANVICSLFVIDVVIFTGFIKYMHILDIFPNKILLPEQIYS